MRLAFSTNAFTNFTVEQAIAEIGRIGYAGVEILADEPHAYPAKIDAAMTRRVVGALSAAKIAVSNVNANCTFGYWKDAPPEPYFEPSLISPVARYRADRLALITRAIEFARDVGAKNISITSGRMLGSVTPGVAAGTFRIRFSACSMSRRSSASMSASNVSRACTSNTSKSSPTGSHGSTRRDLERISMSATARSSARSSRARSIACAAESGICTSKACPAGNITISSPGDLADTFDWHGLKRSLTNIGYDRYATVELTP